MLSVAVIEIEHEINLGYIARVMKNFGLKELLLINPKCNMDKARVFATHGADILDNAKVIEFKDLKFNQIIGTTAIPSSSRLNIVRDVIKPRDLKIKDNSCILLGRESTGLNNQELAKCDVVVSIDTGTDYRTLNISHALAILLYEVCMDNKKMRGASAEEISLLIDYALSLARQSNVREHKIRLLEAALKRIMGRSIPTSKEVMLIVTLLRSAILANKRASKS